MFGKRTGAILCPSCGHLTAAQAPACHNCGYRRPGGFSMLALAAPLLRPGAFVRGAIVASIALYVLALLLDPPAALGGGLGNPLAAFSPGQQALRALGMTGALPCWRDGQWWTLLTATYLHGSLLHLAFNMLWVRQLGPDVESVYGPGRVVVIYTVAGVACFLASALWGVLIPVGAPILFTVGASGAIFGLLGALVAFGRRRGGVFGRAILQQYGFWAVLMFVFGFLQPGFNVNNVGHAGGFVGGLIAGFLLAPAEHRREGAGVRLAAALCLLASAAGLGASLWAALVGW
jgi:rhomboid protease GluP